MIVKRNQSADIFGRPYFYSGCLLLHERSGLDFLWCYGLVWGRRVFFNQFSTANLFAFRVGGVVRDCLKG